MSWVPDLLKVQDSQQEINAEEWEDFNGHLLIPEEEEENERKDRERDRDKSKEKDKDKDKGKDKDKEKDKDKDKEKDKEKEKEKVIGEVYYRVGILGDVGKNN